MDVSSISAERGQEIADASIVEGHVNDAGNLVLTNGAGTESNAGAVVVPYRAWPIGSIFMAVVATDPNILLNGGTWERFGKGKVLVGLDEADGSFDTVLETGGEKTHVLSSAEMPSHVHTGATTVNGDHAHSYVQPADTGGLVEGGGLSQRVIRQAADTGLSGGHVHSLNIDATGGGGAHNNLQPYITVYMWVRTA